MNTHYLKITARSPLIFSESPRTGQQHQCLDYIPGSALWGALASDLYESRAFPEDMLWHLLHSEACQLGNGYPAHVVGDAIYRTLPSSSAWTYNKYAAKEDKTLYNLAQGLPQLKSEQAFQPKKITGGFVGIDFTIVQPQFVTTVKTAIDRDTKTAQDSQLFGYKAIPSGASFIIPVRFDEAQVEASVQASIMQTLSNITHLGRSRSGEFGEVKIEVLAKPISTPPAVDTTQKLNVLWCVSDVYLPNGLDMLHPLKYASGADIDGIGIDWEKSVVTRRQVRTFNRKRGGFDSTLDVISKGSVLVLDQAIAHGTAQYIAEAGLGRMRQCGYGEVMFNPDWYQNSELKAESMPVLLGFEQIETPPKVVSPSNFISRLQARSAQRFNATGADSQMVNDVLEFILSTRRANNISSNQKYGPSATQWRNLLSKCESITDAKALQKSLFGREGLISKDTKNRQWQVTNKQGQTLSEYLESRWAGLSSKHIARTIKLIAMLNPAVSGNLVKATKRHPAQVKKEI